MVSTIRSLCCLALLLAFAACAAAEDVRDSRGAPSSAGGGLDQALFKGIVGNVLDALPMDQQKRVDLQRANAVVSNTLTGRSLSTLLEATNPVLLLGGLVWGLIAASKIEPAAADSKVAMLSAPAERREPAQVVAALPGGERVLAGPAQPSSTEAPATRVEPPRNPAPVRIRVVKVWLP